MSDVLEIQCDECGATVRVEPHLKTAECAYCGSHSIVERPPTGTRPDPSFVVGFVVDRERAQAIVRAWLKSRGMFADSRIKTAVADKTRGVYLPTYLYGGVAHAAYAANIGENYTVTETYTTTVNGKTVTRTRTRTKTEWRPLDGRHASYVVDVVVTASKGLDNHSLEAVEPFDLRALRRYTKKALSGWIAEEPSLTQEQCLAQAHDEAMEKIGRELSDFMPGDSHRDLRYNVTLSNEVVDLVLLPIWVFVMRYAEDKPPVRLIVNGQTGRIAGKTPISAAKVSIAVILAIILIVLFFVFVVGGAS